MLFILTGNVQTGKTRWLGRLLKELAAAGVDGYGVLAPGVWRPRDGGECQEEYPPGAGCGAYEKRGIDNILLPQEERLTFARRRDLAQKEGMFDQGSQSAAARLVWEMPDEAIARVNTHFDELSQRARASCEGSGLLVVDEVGRLELDHGTGLTSALAMLDRGPSNLFPHALIVVRPWLLERAEERFVRVWGDVRVIEPNDEGRAVVFSAFALASIIDRNYH